MKTYFAFALVRETRRDRSGCSRAWANAQPKSRYDVIIVGAGGHGLATA